MRSIIIAGFVIALASGLFLNYAGHPWQAFAQANNTKNATQSSTGASSGAGGNATSQKQGGGAAGGGGNATTTPPSTVSTVKGGPKAAGSASQLQQLTGPNASQIASSNAPVGNKPGVQGLGAESTTTSQKNATSTSAGSAANKTSAGASSATKNATSAAGSAANKTSAGAQNATGGGQAKNNTNPLAKVPVIGKLFGG